MFLIRLSFSIQRFKIVYSYVELKKFKLFCNLFTSTEWWLKKNWFKKSPYESSYSWRRTVDFEDNGWLGFFFLNHVQCQDGN